MKEKEDRTALFETMPVPEAVAKLAVPTILSSLVMVLYNMADTFFVGMLGDPVQNAAVTLVAPVMLAFNAVNNLFGVGSSSMMSRALGRKDYDMVARSSVFGFWCSIISGILFSLLCTIFLSPLLTLLGADEVTRDATVGYMFWTVNMGAMPSILNVVMAYLVRSEGAAMHASIGTMSGCILNMILDPIFILPWGFDMGAAGAGLATFISNCVACLYFILLICIKRGRTYVCMDPRKLSFDGRIVKGVCTVGIPASIQNLLNVAGMTILNNFASGYGASVVAAVGIAQKINQVPYYISSGLSQGIMPLVSYNFSSGNADRMKKTVTFSGKAAVGLLTVIGVIFFIFPDTFISLFMKDEAVIGYGAQFLRGFSTALPFHCIDFLAVAVFQATGMGQYSFAFAVLRKIILEIPAMIILNMIFPLYGLAYAQLVAEVVLAAAAIIMLSRIFRRVEKFGAVSE